MAAARPVIARRVGALPGGTRALHPGRVANARGAELPEVPARGDFRHPAKVPFRADARKLDRAQRSAIDVGRQAERDAGGMTRAHGAVARRRLAVGSGRPERRGDARPIAQGHLVGDRDAREERPAEGREKHGDQGGTSQPDGPRGPWPERSLGETQTGIEARPGERQNPRVGALRGRQQGLPPASQQLAQDPGDGWDQQERAAQPEPDHSGKGTDPPGGGRPAQRADADNDRNEAGQTDQLVDRAARLIHEQHETGGERPKRRQHRSDEAGFEDPDAHRMESTRLPVAARP